MANDKVANNLILLDSQVNELIEIAKNTPNLQEKTVTPTKEEQRVTYDAEYDGLEAVTVGAVTADIDSNIKAENIKSGVSVLGVEGTASVAEFSADGRLYAETLTLPNNVTSIGENAFSHTQIKKITIPDTVTSVGIMAFYYAKTEEIIMGDGVLTIGSQCFRNSNIKNLTLSKNITLISSYAFGDMRNLTALTLPDKLKEVQNNAFQYTYIPEWIFPDGVEKLGNQLFMVARITKIHLPATVTSIGIYAFQSCTSVTDFTVGEGFSCSLYIQYLTKLPAETLEAIIDNYADLTGQTPVTLSIGAVNIAKLSTEYQQKAIDKNIELQ